MNFYQTIAREFALIIEGCPLCNPCIFVAWSDHIADSDGFTYELNVLLLIPPDLLTSLSNLKHSALM